MIPILDFQKRILTQLSAWSLASVFAGGLLALFSTAGSFWQAFGGMNAVWGLINLVIASFGFYGVFRKMHKGVADAEREKRNLLRLLKVNAFLDVGYVAVGLAMTLWGRTPLLQGFGWGIILQGGFLLLFDTSHYLQGGRT